MLKLQTWYGGSPNNIIYIIQYTIVDYVTKCKKFFKFVNKYSERKFFFILF